jgi:hypothetical protein
MIPKSGHRFSDKIMLHYEAKIVAAGTRPAAGISRDVRSNA